MQVRNQVVDAGAVILDVMLPARNDWSALHSLLDFHGVAYNANKFIRRGDWAMYRDGNVIYRTMTSRKFG